MRGRVEGSATRVNRVTSGGAVVLLWVVLAGCETPPPLDPVPVTGSISGRVSAANEPFGGVVVALTGPADASDTTDAEGAFDFGGLAAGSYSVGIRGFPAALAFDATTQSVVIPVGGGETTVTFDGSWPPLTVDSVVAPSGIIGAPWSIAFAARGGDGTYTWALTNGDLPTGIELSEEGVLAGTATETGAFEFTVTVTSGDEQSASTELTVSMWSALGFPPVVAPSGVVGSAYELVLSPEGGDGSYLWSVSAGALPGGLTLGPDGTISGVPSTVESASFTVTATSGDGQSAAIELEIVTYPGLVLHTESAPDATEGAAYTLALEASGGDGAYSWSLSDGALPAGFSLDGAGVITGTGGSAEEAQFTARVESGDGQSAERDLVLRVNGILVILDAPLPPSRLDEPYDVAIGFSGGDGANSWSLVSGALPTGLSLDPVTGIIGGVATSAGSFDFTVMVTSGDGQQADRAFTLDATISPRALCSNYPSSTVIPFEDPVVAEAVRVAAGVAGAPTCAELAGITSLGPIDGAASLAGVQNLTDVGNLAVQRGTISDLTPVASLPQLLVLDVSYNEVSDLGPLSSLTTLTTLRVEGNAITDLSPVGANTGLIILDVESNDLSDLSTVGSLTQLSQLYARGNAISDLTPLVGLTELSNVDLAENQISNIGPLANKTAIYRLRIEGNPIGDFSPLSTLSALDAVGLGETGISDFSALVGLPVLTWISAPDNGLSDLGALAAIPGLEFLFLMGNEITDLSPLTGLGSLLFVNLNENASLSNLQPLIDSPTIGGARVFLRGTAVDCADAAALAALGTDVRSDCTP